MSGNAWLRSLTEHRELHSFDCGVTAACGVSRPDRYAAFSSPVEANAPLMARGSGVSYAAASFIDGGTVIDMRLFDRILDFDSASGAIHIEAGVTLARLFDFLAPRGRYLPVQPGHRRISVGGCIAADVHGKNPARDGTFSDQVEQISLFHPAHGLIEISRKHEPELFAATCGGYGLTGVIVSAHLATRPLAGAAAVVEVSRPADAQSVVQEMRGKAGGSDMLYSWHDLIGDGRGMVFSGRFLPAAAPSVPGKMKEPREISADWRRALPVGVFNALTGRLLNRVYASRNRPGTKEVPLREMLFPIEGKETYFRLFGAVGFHEAQVIVPFDAFAGYVGEVKSLARKSGVPIVLASGKLFDGAPRFLRFSGQGISLAINVPRSKRSSSFMQALDDRIIAFRGRPNIIKDSRLPRRVVEACYPEYDAFRNFLQRWDAKRLFRSELSQRLGL